MIHIAFSVDDNFVRHMGVAMTSILLNSSEKDEFHFHVIAESISEISRERVLSLREIKDFNIEIIDVEVVIREKIDQLKRLALRSHFPSSAYYRLLVGSILKGLDKVLYLDSDVVVRGSLQDLWKTDLADRTLGVVKQPDGSYPLDPHIGVTNYFNSGVLLFNLTRWRMMGYEQRCFDVEDSIIEKIQYPDQSILNYVFRGEDLVHLGIQFNYLVCLEEYIREKDFCGSISEPVIIHYAGLKPWELSLDIFSQDGPLPRLFSYYWDYRDITPWGKEPFKGAIRWKNIFRYVARHPKEISFVVKKVNEWGKGIYRR